ncbi:hypothetical protein [Nostoc sp. FACHB-888]|uniref:hypothetical protein n=1 Tax=Nostoc sp. FACHB-888 TaxID=2692842 RepID=UPI0016861B72|nr:hypothetical protein [Nostoc sp. FACHB-888]MBD2247464.1 hypothetical protein [Nostoc sp. FACHB-888]
MFNKFDYVAKLASALTLIFFSMAFVAQADQKAFAQIVRSGTSGSNNWKEYDSSRPGFGIYIDVNTNTGFTQTPIYVTSLACNNRCWVTTGGSAVYNATPNGFRVYVRNVDGSPLYPTEAQRDGWTINWIGTR